jgi:hypothetical protein
MRKSLTRAGLAALLLILATASTAFAGQGSRDDRGKPY